MAKREEKLKKDYVVVEVKNDSQYNLQLASSLLREGDYKNSTPLQAIGPKSTGSMTLKKPDGEFMWIVKEDDPAQNQLKLHLSYKNREAKVEPSPPTSLWVCTVEQVWQAGARVRIVVMARDQIGGTNAAAPTKTKHKKKLEESDSVSALPAVGKVKHKKTRRSSSVSKKDELSSSTQDKDDDSSDVEAHPHRLSVIIRTDSKLDDSTEDLKSAASFLANALPKRVVKRTASLSASEPRRASSIFEGNIFADDPFEDKKGASFISDLGSTQSPRSDFSSDMTEEEQLQLAMAISASEAEAKAKSEKSKSKKDKEKSKIKVTNSSATDQEVSAIQRFTQALDSLDSGDLVGALSHLTAAIDSLPAGSSPYLREWAGYRMVISLMLEMQRLEQEKLWEQRALLARFVAEIAAATLSRTEHRLIALRCGINRNLEIGNFLTAGRILGLMRMEESLSQAESNIVEQKLDLCREHGYSEKFVPTGCTADPSIGVSLNGTKLVLCMKSMKLIRSNQALHCAQCDAHFESTTGLTKCPFSNSDLTLTSL